MSYMLPHLDNGWQVISNKFPLVHGFFKVDQAILSEEDRVVVIRFGHDWDPTCMRMDEVRSQGVFLRAFLSRPSSK